VAYQAPGTLRRLMSVGIGRRLLQLALSKVAALTQRFRKRLSRDYQVGMINPARMVDM
jgi:hypothetical protein